MPTCAAFEEVVGGLVVVVRDECFGCVGRAEVDHGDHDATPTGVADVRCPIRCDTVAVSTFRQGGDPW